MITKGKKKGKKAVGTPHPILLVLYHFVLLLSHSIKIMQWQNGPFLTLLSTHVTRLGQNFGCMK